RAALPAALERVRAGAAAGRDRPHRGLLAGRRDAPRRGRPRAARKRGREERVSAVATAPLLRAEGVVKHFRVGGLRSRAATVQAVAGVDLELRRGEILAVVGESGSGKSTLGRCLLGLTRPTSGRIVFDDVDLTSAGGRTLRSLRRRLQPVFQNPYGSLDP